MVFNEMGVTYYKLQNYDQAQENLAHALSLCRETNSSTYESILLNLGHCHRKNKDFESAIRLYN